MTKPLISIPPTLKQLEALTPQERERFDQLIALLHPSGVCINVMLSNQPWDVRPLFLDRGIVWIYRVSQEVTDSQASDLLRAYATASNGVIDKDTTFGKVTDRNQIWVRRRYYQATLLDDVRAGKFPDSLRGAAVLQELMAKISQLHSRGEVHGHVWLGNLAWIDSELKILDPVLGTYPRPVRADLADLSPEVARGSSDMSSDVYGVVTVALHLFGETMPSGIRAQLESILSLPPARRPRLVEVAPMILPETHAPATAVQQPPSAGGSGGKVIGMTRPPASRPSVVADTTNAKPSSDPEFISSEHLGTPAASPDLMARFSTFVRQNQILSGVGALILLTAALRYGAPATYFRIARILPFVDRQVDPQLESDWMSGDRSRMRDVARQAVVDRRPSAENAIVMAALSAAKATNFDANVIRVAYDERWADDLRERDRQSALALAVRQVYPEALAYLSPIESLHPGVILAVTGQMDFVDPSKQMSVVQTEQLASLPSPLGDLFSALSKIGLKTLDQPGALAACHIATGATSPGVIEAYFGAKPELSEVFPRLAALMVIIDQSRELGDSAATVLKDGGGPVGQALAWFEGEDLSQWSDLSGASRLSLLLGKLPRKTLTLEQYADLLLYPLPAVRGEALKALVRQYLTEKSAPMLSVIASDQSRLTRKQVVALVAALHLRTDSAGSFVSVWFQTAPDPLTVLRLLNARAAFEVPDTFNLEAARYLRKLDWQGSFEDLKILAAHPEPLARSLAYGKLSVSIAGEAELLKNRLKVETDPTLKETLQRRLGSGEIGR